jgi:hypothetical protein
LFSPQEKHNSRTKQQKRKTFENFNNTNLFGIYLPPKLPEIVIEKLTCTPGPCKRVVHSPQASSSQDFRIGPLDTVFSLLPIIWSPEYYQGIGEESNARLDIPLPPCKGYVTDIAN